ncbi:MAG: hypothetical protein HOM61_03705 [Candidatus Marinimicrobia bacterium]|nr:hypothetical protein [Candidatus Neomarinimicrobiota bacterium]
MKIYLIIIVSIYSFLFSQSIEHEKVNHAIQGNTIELKIYVDAPDREISKALLMYRSETHQTFLEQSMDELASNQFITNLPGYFVEESNISYFFVVTFIDGGLTSFPFQSPYENPMVIEVDSPQVNESNTPKVGKNPGELLGLKSDALIISPVPNSTVSSDELVAVVSFFSMKNVDMSSIEVFFDEINIDEFVEREISHFTCNFPFSKRGRHRFRVELKNNLGQSFEPISWNFNVVDPEKTDWFSQLVEHRGRIWSSHSSTNVDGLNNNRNDLNLKYSADLDWIRISMSGLNSSLDNPYQQTRNRYAINFTNDNIKISLGDFFPQINKFSLNGNRIRGFGAEIDYKYFNLNLVRGKMVHEIQGDISDGAMVISQFQAPQDTLNGFIKISRDNYTFKRDVTALKLGMGIPKRVYFNIDMVKVKDNTLSVYNYMPGASIQISDEIWREIDDTTANYLFQIDDRDYIIYEDLKANLVSMFGSNYDLVLMDDNWGWNKPKDNIMLGSDFLFSFDKKRVSIKAGFTFSLLNQNIWESITSITELDTMGGDTTLDGKFMGLYEISDDFLSYSDFFEFGVNQVPLIPVSTAEDISAFSKIFNLPSVVYNFETKMNYAGHNIKYKYLQVGPEFNSLVNPYIQTNIREKTISDRVRLLGNRMILNTKWIRKENGIDAKDENTIFTNRYDTNMGLYPGAGLPTFNIGFTSIHRMSEKERIDEVIIEVFDGAENDTLVTDNRLETLSKQINLALTNTFEVFGQQQLSLNVFNSDKADLLFEKKVLSNPDYYSPQTNSTNTNFNIYSKHSDLWESNISFSASEYETSIATELHPDYFQEQNVKRWSIKLIRNKWTYSDKFSVNLTFTKGNGTVDFKELGYSISGIHKLYNIIHFNWNYGFNRKTITDSDTNLNTTFRAKLLYTI